MLVEFLQYLIFPGVILTLYLSIVSEWTFRKFMARFENRVGPPFNQPLFDYAKLMAKERMYPENSNGWIMHYFPRIQVGIALFMTLFIPITGDQGLISFKGDILFFLFLLTLHGSSSFFIGWASHNPYTISGAGRAVLTEISLEIPLAISIAGIAILTESITIAEMTRNISRMVLPMQSWKSLLYIIPLIILLVSIGLSILGACELNPFSAAHAETEIVGGWQTEISGSDLAYAKLAEFIDLFNLSAITAALFLGGPTVISLDTTSIWSSILITGVSIVTFLIKTGFIILILTFIATTSSRLRIDQTIDLLWIVILPLSLLGVAMIMIVKTFVLGGG